MHTVQRAATYPRVLVVYRSTTPHPFVSAGIEVRLKEDGAGAFRKPEEYFARSDFFEEREMIIPPDVTIAEDEDLGGMLFHVF